jgi:predicted DNA-binding protein
MPISIRLPADIETRLAGFGSRTGLSKSAVIVRSIQEFLARNAAPSSLQIYEEAMQASKLQRSDPKTGLASEASAQRTGKLAMRQALRKKHNERSQRATNALAAKRGSPAKSP